MKPAFIHSFCFRLVKQNCSDEEASEKAKLRKAVKEKCSDFMKMTEQKNLLGAGTYGEVWTLNLKGQTKLFVQKVSRNMKGTYCIQMEVMILSTFDNIKYIPKLIYSGYTLDGKWCLIMEYFTGGSLDDHILEEFAMRFKNMKAKISLIQKLYIAYHLACALEALHEKNCTHGYA